MLGDVLLYLLLLAGGLALVHVAVIFLGRELPIAGFVVFGAVLSTAAGLWITHEAILGQARRSPVTGVLWTLLLGLGFFVVGAVLAAAWALGIRGVGLLAGRAFRRER